MKQITCNRPVTLGEGDDRKEFLKGTHQVDDRYCQGWFFEAAKTDGWIVVAETEVAAAEGAGAVDGARILAEPAKAVVTILESEAFSVEVLRDLLAAEQAGKNRSSVVATLTERIEAHA